MTPPPPPKKNGDERNEIQVPDWYLLHGVESWVAIGAQLLKEFPTFYATQILISAFTSVCHWTLLRQRNTAEIITFKILKIYFNTTLHLWPSPSKRSLPYRLNKILWPFSFSCAYYRFCQLHSPWFVHLNYICSTVHIATYNLPLSHYFFFS